MADLTAKEKIESIVGMLEQQGMRAAPELEAVALAASEPTAVRDLALAVINRFPKGGTFLDAALSWLPEEDWPELIEQALDAIEKTGSKNEAASSVIAYASLQAVSALHPHLSRIFEIRPNSGCYYEPWPWRDSGEQNVEFLHNVVTSETATEEARLRAWKSMIQTRHPKVIEFAISQVDRIDFSEYGFSTDGWILANLHLVGFHWVGGKLHRTYPDALYHLIFPDSYFEDENRPPWLKKVHPTWKLSSNGHRISFGGMGSGVCSLCGQTLHRLLAFDPLPQEVAATGLARLEIVACLSCLGWQDQPLFYLHDEQGAPENIGYGGPPMQPEFPARPLKVCEGWLAETPRRWRRQDWALSNSRENLNRVGGEPCWIQNAEYPNCPSCRQMMTFLLQLDSDLPTEDGGEWLWGSGGIGYVFWCDVCKVSGLLWQCT